MTTIEARELVFRMIFTGLFRIITILHINRPISLHSKTYLLTDYFKGLEKSEAVSKIFGEKTEEVLHNIRIEFTKFIGYMGTSDTDGHIIVNARYLTKGDKVDIHLDIIHELVHVKQFMEGKGLFDPNYDYVDRPTEIEAYHYAVEEARRIGLSDERICEYLKTEWMSNEGLKRLAKALNVKYVR